MEISRRVPQRASGVFPTTNLGPECDKAWPGGAGGALVECARTSGHVRAQGPRWCVHMDAEGMLDRHQPARRPLTPGPTAAAAAAAACAPLPVQAEGEGIAGSVLEVPTWILAIIFLCLVVFSFLVEVVSTPETIAAPCLVLRQLGCLRHP